MSNQPAHFPEHSLAGQHSSFRWLRLATPALAGAPLALVLVLSLSNQPDYEALPFLAIIAGALAWARGKNEPEGIAGKTIPSAWLVVAFSGLLAVTIFGIQRMSLLWILGASVATAWVRGGWPMVRAWAPPVACILWAVPPPLGLHAWATRQLQALAIEACHHVLMAADILHAVRGLLIALPEHTFFVSEACSGIRSLTSLGAFSSLWAIAAKRPAWHVALLLACTIGWVLIVNIARILAVVFGFKLGIDLSEGWSHQALGLAAFLIGLVLVAGTDIAIAWLHQVLGRPRSLPNFIPTAYDQSRGAPRTWPRWVIVTSASLFLMQTGVASLVLARKVPDWSATGHLPAMTGVLPESLGGWRMVSGPDLVESTGMLALGVRSQQWRYVGHGLAAQVAMDDNFPGWHPLDDCYIFAGWIQTDFSVNDGALGPVMTAVYEREGGRRGFLAYGLRSRQGRWIGPPDITARYSIALVNYLKYLYLGQDVSGTESPTRQVQVFVSSPRPFDPAIRERIMELFEEARARLDPLLWPEE